VVKVFVVVLLTLRVSYENKLELVIRCHEDMVHLLMTLRETNYHGKDRKLLSVPFMLRRHVAFYHKFQKVMKEETFNEMKEFFVEKI
jgi:hypothetical protein